MSIKHFGAPRAPQQFINHSAVKTASALIFTGPCMFSGIIVFTDGTNAVTINIRDAVSAAGEDKLCPTNMIITTSSADRVFYYAPPGDLLCDTGLHIEITCSGSVSYIVFYD